jgi:Fe-S-cluster containining protein
MESDSGSLKGTIELRVGPRATKLHVTVPRGDVELGAVLPVARQMTEAVVKWAVTDAETAGKAISCRAGCGACCRQPVPVGHAEARRLSRLVDEMPEPRRSAVRGRFEDALVRLGKTDLLQRQAALAAADTGGRPQDYYLEWCRDYFRLELACPFLEDESCSIHPERPLICREYLVTSPASECASLSCDNIRRVPIKASVFNAVRKLEHGSGLGHWMPLVTALKWAPFAGKIEPRAALDWVRSLQQFLGRNAESGSGSGPVVAPND